ncbi:MAG: gamma-glutamyl-phosphate reductase [Proteobacteria bacterium SG_bin7]|nr:MAG: gamma-glutamyl-phosphate reductase [Proteobacteria bacterium SG_bin7]
MEKTFLHLREAARELRQLVSKEKNYILNEIAKKVASSSNEIQNANQKDLKALVKDATPAFRDRLVLNQKRIDSMVESLRQVSELKDPVNEVIEERTLQNGLRVKRVRSPLGVIFMIFESRPNVILEAFSLAYKSGNVIALRGGRESAHTSKVIYKIISDSLKQYHSKFLPFFGFNDYDRKIIKALLKRSDLVDIVVPRGGERLIEMVQKTAAMPVIKNDRGLCHTYVADDADVEMAVEIVNNAKTQRPGVCNALETVLVHKSVADSFIKKLYTRTRDTNLIWHTDKATLKILKASDNVIAAKEKDWDTEYLDLVINCKVVKNLEEAISHIEKHGSKHSETIVTSSEEKARKFQNEIDAAAVYWNASTRFTDGFEFGLGGELGISTQKLHVRGPVGLRELTTPRWIIDGNGQIRK